MDPETRLREQLRDQVDGVELPPGFLERAHRGMQRRERRRRAVPAATGALVLVLVGVLVVPRILEGAGSASLQAQGGAESGGAESAGAENAPVAPLLQPTRADWRFTAPAGPPLGAPAVAGGLVYVGSDGGAGAGRLFAVGAADGRQRWATPMPGPLTAAPVFGDGAVYASVPGRVLAFDALTGSALWNAPLPPSAACLAAQPGVVFCGAGTLRAADGTAASSPPVAPLPGPVVGAGPDVLYVLGPGGALAAVEPVTGGARWEAPARTSDPVLASEAVVLDGDLVHARTVAGATVTFDAATGATVASPGDVAVARPAAAGGRVYLPTRTGVGVYDARSGRRLRHLAGEAPAGLAIAGPDLLVSAGRVLSRVDR